MRTRMSKMTKLLREMVRKNGMTHSEVVRFLLRGTGLELNRNTSRYFNPNLFGTPERESFYNRFCRKMKTTGKYKVRANVNFNGPFSPKRVETTPVTFYNV